MIKKKISVLLSILIFILFTGCDTSIEPPTNNPTEKEILSVGDYYPLVSDMKYIYHGEGNEYASYTVLIDYLDLKNQKIQTRTDNGGTETVKVIEIKDGKLSVINTKSESYYRDNLLNSVASEPEILLMEPLVEGTQWILADNRVRSISNLEVEIQTPIGNFKALEVTTQGPNDVVKDYYVPNIGLVKSIFVSEHSEVTSTLSEIMEDTPFSKDIQFYYPGEDGKLYGFKKNLLFYTNDISRITIQNAMRENAPKDNLLSLMSPNTKINSLYLGKDGIAYIDLSREFIDDMNLGALYESLVLQSITNTIGNYYGVQRVYLTVENMPYESGHILLYFGNAFQLLVV